MKKLLVSIDPEIYVKYKGLYNYLDSITRAIAEFNFENKDCDTFMSGMINWANKDTHNVCIHAENDFTYSIIHTKHSVTIGNITRINLL